MGYTIGTGIMNSKLNNGNIISVPLLDGEEYIIGYLTKNNKRNSDYLQRFLNLLEKFGADFETNIE